MQVSILRDELGVSNDPCMIHLDADGLKKLFNHGVRRFKATGSATRVPWIKIKPMLLFDLKQVAAHCDHHCSKHLKPLG